MTPPLGPFAPEQCDRCGFLSFDLALVRIIVDGRQGQGLAAQYAVQNICRLCRRS